jgi:hypothetical protein
VYGLEITTCYYKGLLQEYVTLSYGFLNKRPPCSAKVSSISTPSCTMWERRFTKYVAKYDAIPHPIEQGTQPILFLISRQAVPYRASGGTCYPRVSTPKIQSLADSSTTCHGGFNRLPHSDHCSNHNIDPHTVTSHLDGWKTTTLSQRDKPTQHHKGWKTCTTLKTVWLSITNQVQNQNPKGISLR